MILIKKITTYILILSLLTMSTVGCKDSSVEDRWNIGELSQLNLSIEDDHSDFGPYRTPKDDFIDKLNEGSRTIRASAIDGYATTNKPVESALNYKDWIKLSHRVDYSDLGEIHTWYETEDIYGDPDKFSQGNNDSIFSNFVRNDSAPSPKSHGVTILSHGKKLTIDEFERLIKSERKHLKIKIFKFNELSKEQRDSLNQVKDNAIENGRDSINKVYDSLNEYNIDLDDFDYNADKTPLNNSIRDAEIYLESVIEKVTGDTEDIYTIAEDILEQSKEYSKIGSLQEAEARAKNVKLLADAILNKDKLPPLFETDEMDESTRQRTRALNASMDLYQVAINFDKSGFPGLAKKSSGHAGILLEAAMQVVRFNDIVDIPMNIMEVSTGKTVDFDKYGNPIIREMSTYEWSLSLVNLTLTGGGGILGGLPGAITGSYLYKGIEKVADFTKKVIKPQIVKKLTRANKSLDEATEIAIKTSDEIKDIATGIFNSTDNLVSHSPINPGLLSRKELGSGMVSDTFRSGTYLSYVNKEPINLYRVYSAPDHLGHASNFWSKVKPSSPTQAMIDIALDPSWGNRATKWIEIELPSGHQVYEGAAASILKQGNNISEFVGGGNQIYLNLDVQPEWIIKRGTF